MPEEIPPRLFRVVLLVFDINRAVGFYGLLLGLPGKRISPGRHYFNCGDTILVCHDPRADGHDFDAQPNPDHVYFAVPNLDEVFARAKEADCSWLEEEIRERPWGERSFYAKDPFGNPLCFVDAKTMFTGNP